MIVKFFSVFKLSEINTKKIIVNCLFLIRYRTSYEIAIQFRKNREDIDLQNYIFAQHYGIRLG